MSNGHGGGRRGAGRPPKNIKIAVNPAERDLEQEKFLFMLSLSDKQPICTLPVSMPCQKPGCSNYTMQGSIQMVNRVWSIRPICEKCVAEK